MSKVLLHTPEGVRDVYGKECASKIALENKLNDVFTLYGYQNIQTPTFEFFDIFNKEKGSVQSKDLYKFFDREGNTLVLRPDATPSICRSVAKYFMDDIVPVKLCYKANTFVNNYELQGKLKESTNMGCELIGDNSIDADAEIIAVVVDSLKKSGLKEFLVEIGDVNFFKGLLEECNFTEEQEEELKDLVQNKNFYGVETFLDSLGAPENVCNAFNKFPELFGQKEVLDLAKTLTSNERALMAIDRLEKLYNILDLYGATKYISFDLGMVSSFNYYTNIIFKAYTYGIGDAVVTGGRYDKLLSQFGKDAASIGFGIHVDRLLLALYGQRVEVDCDYAYEVIVFEENKRKDAMKLAASLRKKGVKTELILKSENIDINEYVTFKQDNGATKVTYLK
ncbi:MAG: ATP phosphoribosyltransferase regulatory subunit [Lachnospiraceae bacterium]|nr:ATP phosphoribosyltransferase regulatory subunit [Lachnospiraceae bacterium]